MAAVKAIPEGQLRALLDAYLEDLRHDDPEGYPMTSAQYLGIWCDDAHRFLRKFYSEDSNEPVFELTSGSEKALLWMEQLQGNTGFVDNTEAEYYSASSGKSGGQKSLLAFTILASAITAQYGLNGDQDDIHRFRLVVVDGCGPDAGIQQNRGDG